MILHLVTLFGLSDQVIRPGTTGPDHDPGVDPRQHPPGQADKGCWCCANLAMPGKVVCEDCFIEATWDKDTDNAHIVGLIKQLVNIAYFQANSSSAQGEASYFSRLKTEAENVAGVASDDSLLGFTDDEEAPIFVFSLIHPLIKAVRPALIVDEVEREVLKQKPLFQRAKKENHAFPYFDEFKILFSVEWVQAEKRTSVQNHFSMLYPFFRHQEP